ncbi:hypothetical protein CYMTET_27252 [Cymbomonas tetramitiformis]|uniref:Ion transport domain-containing protein n=1 Tax=Cymbomonas tetramitiformis TaxID=36881 RepID=A0AAE0FQH4_9CHLO|nr:hypothetical protein CYMTET_27252 [Cymbomonas tetramitiformis]
MAAVVLATIERKKNADARRQIVAGLADSQDAATEGSTEADGDASGESRRSVEDLTTSKSKSMKLDKTASAGRPAENVGGGAAAADGGVGGGGISISELRHDIKMRNDARSKEGGDAELARQRNLPYQQFLHKVYNGAAVQIFVASLIFVNFIVNAAEAQVPQEERGSQPFKVFEVIFTVAFTVELVVNIYAHWFWEFWSSGWNIFDFVVVGVSLLAIALSGLPAVSMLRLLRAFRVFRLFRRLQSLRRIIKALEEAIPGSANAFAILSLVSAIYSILGVEFFQNIEFETGNKYFDTFGQAMFTMFQVMSGDSWAEAIARPCVAEYPLASLYFVSYILVADLMLVNVVVAVLMEKFVDTAGDEEENDAEDFAAEEAAIAQNTATGEAATVPQLVAIPEPSFLTIEEPLDMAEHEARKKKEKSAKGKSKGSEEALELLLPIFAQLQQQVTKLDSRLANIESCMAKQDQ